MRIDPWVLGCLGLGWGLALTSGCSHPTGDSQDVGASETQADEGDGDGDGDGDREPYVDAWRIELTGPAAQLTRLSIGDRLTNDNYANRGDIEVLYVDGTDQITVEMQRFTIAMSQEDAADAFLRMEFWDFDVSLPAAPNTLDPAAKCFANGVTGCYIRNYYNGQLQPVRDGVNFRITVPRGWDGDLLLTTEDNLFAGLTVYPDRGDIVVDGVAGDLTVDLDSGNVDVRMDPETDHFAGCPGSDECVAMGFPDSCACDEPTNIDIANKAHQSSNIHVDVGNDEAWYTMILENRGIDPSCSATIDCSNFGSCQIDPEYAMVEFQERAEVNFPGGEAIAGAGIRISLVSEDCSTIAHVGGPEDYEADPMPHEKRGDVSVCAGC